ncbi:MAG TPA: diguanylate cyclase [Kiritimatiellia bacterium]|nr:diguanylate cyclase [Kiritimatiellia bacterium]
MEMSATEWWGAIGQVGLVVAVSFVILLAATSFIRFQLMMERAVESEELGEGEDRMFRLSVLNAVAGARKKQRPLSVVLLKLPETGSSADEISERLKSLLRASDTVMVCDGHTVGLILDCGSERADIPVKRLAAAATSENVTGATFWRFGVAGYPEHGFKTSVLYARAREMLVEAEAGGKLIAGMAPLEEVAEEKDAPADMIDPVTGVVREDKMIGVMRRFIASERRADRPVSMVYFDIDQFVPLAGRPADKLSNALLKEMAGYIGNMIRESDMLARFGEGGFVVAMPASPDAAMLAAQRVTHAVRKHVFKTGVDLKVTISAGVAGYPDVLGTAVQYFVAAETALQHARMRGRNQCVKFDHTMQLKVEDEKHIDSL